MARVVLLGPPGAGKGTQAKFLQEKLGVCQVSTGDILRRAMADETTLGKKAAAYVRQGGLVPDDLMVDLVRERLDGEDCRAGFILDGFPRTIAQAQSLQETLGAMGWTLDSVLSLEVPREIIIERLAGRRTCKNCAALYHVAFDRPRENGRCDRCGGELYQREDDREETINARLNVYETQTAPLIDYYRQRGMLRAVNGADGIEEIRRRIVKVLGDVAA